MSEMVERVALAIAKQLQTNREGFWMAVEPMTVFVGDDFEEVDTPRGMKFDGDLDLDALARAALEVMRDQVMLVVSKRHAIYEAKADQRDPFGDDVANAYDLAKHAMEATECLEAELRALFDAALSEDPAKEPRP